MRSALRLATLLSLSLLGGYSCSKEARTSEQAKEATTSEQAKEATTSEQAKEATTSEQAAAVEEVPLDPQRYVDLLSDLKSLKRDDPGYDKLEEKVYERHKTSAESEDEFRVKTSSDPQVARQVVAIVVKTDWGMAPLLFFAGTHGFQNDKYQQCIAVSEKKAEELHEKGFLTARSGDKKAADKLTAEGMVVRVAGIKECLPIAVQ